MQVLIEYTSYRGIRSKRRILPLSIAFTSNEWHPEPQWILTAHDLDRDVERHFAMKDVHSWTPQPNE
jgi:predicted DNA-binding transcriptional regulator YafY